MSAKGRIQDTEAGAEEEGMQGLHQGVNKRYARCSQGQAPSHSRGIPLHRHSQHTQPSTRPSVKKKRPTDAVDTHPRNCPPKPHHDGAQRRTPQMGAHAKRLRTSTNTKASKPSASLTPA